MTEKQIVKLKQQARARYEQAVKAAEVVLLDELRSIEVVYRVDQGSESANVQADPDFIGPYQPHMDESGSGRASDLSEHLTKSLPKLPITFSLNDAFVLLQECAPELNGALKRRSVSNALQNLVQKHLLVVKDQGRGRRPTIYERAEGLTEAAP